MVTYASFTLWVLLAFFFGVHFGRFIAEMLQSAPCAEEITEDEEYDELLSRL